LIYAAEAAASERPHRFRRIASFSASIIFALLARTATHAEVHQPVAQPSPTDSPADRIDPTSPPSPGDSAPPDATSAPYRKRDSIQMPGNRPALRLDGYGAVAFALHNAPSLLAQAATILANDLSYTRDRAAEYPALTGELQNQISKQGNQVGNFAQFGLSPQNNFSENLAQLGATYNLYNGGAQLTAEQAKRFTEASKFELRRQEEQLAIAVTNNFYALAASHRIVVLDEADVRYQQALLDAARASERVGRVAGVDVLRARVAVTRSESALVQARVDETNARESLAVQIGAPAETAFAVPADVPEPARPQVANAVLNSIARLNRPEILSAKANFAYAKLGDATVDNDLRPVVQLGGSFGSQVSPTSLVQQQQEIDAENASALASYQSETAMFPGVAFPAPVVIPPVNRNAPGFWQFNITSTFQIPIYDYGVRAAAHHAARGQIESALAALYNAYDAVQADVNAAQRNLDSADEKLQLAKDSSALATESARIAQLQYKNGLISFTDATQTEQTALAAQNDLVSARVTYVSALIRLRVALAPPDTAAAADVGGGR
jgi:outer membrane protein TolC